ncbi:acyl carrier protein [Stenotrophomonas maltophilia]|nr:phosphopantetheine-binding protein [Stenotrophomonas maltophilia]
MNADILSNTLDSLKPIICDQTGLRPDEVHPHMRLREDLCIDSLALHAILIEVEDQWNVMPGAEQIDAAQTMADFAAAIAALRGGS